MCDAPQASTTFLMPLNCKSICTISGTRCDVNPGWVLVSVSRGRKLSTKCRKHSVSRSEMKVFELKTSKLKPISRHTWKDDNLVTTPASMASEEFSTAHLPSDDLSGEGEGELLGNRRCLRSNNSSCVGQTHTRFDFKHLSHREGLKASSHFFLLLRPVKGTTSVEQTSVQITPHTSQASSLCSESRAGGLLSRHIARDTIACPPHSLCL